MRTSFPAATHTAILNLPAQTAKRPVTVASYSFVNNTDLIVIRKIIHVDMDCFYAAVEVRDRPELKGHPVAVGGLPSSRGVIATANYEARRFGVRSAMPSQTAMKKCPQLTLLEPNFDKYRTESRRLRDIFLRYTSIIEPLSLDEAFLDVSECAEFKGIATAIARDIRLAIFNECGLTASAGIAPNKFLAKIASEWRKPNGQFTIAPQHIDEFVRALPVEKIFGVGKVTAEKMHGMGIQTCADLQKMDVLELVRRFGKWGQRLHELSFGIDNRPVKPEREPKSISVEYTFNRDLQSWEDMEKEVLGLYEDLGQRLVRKKIKDLRIKGCFIKVKYADFRQTTHEKAGERFQTLNEYLELLKLSWEKTPHPVRLIGLGVRLRPMDEYELKQAQLRLI